MLEPKTILVVDDDPFIQKLLGAHLQQAGYQTLEAGDGMSCIGMVRRTVPDLVVLDLGLPGGDGATALRSLRSLSQMASVPVLVVSGRDQDEWAEPMRILGANGYLEKPVQPEQIVIAVQTLLGDHERSAAAADAPHTLISCPHCGGEVGTLTNAAVQSIIAESGER